MEQILQSKSVLTLQSEPRIYLAAFKKNVLNRSLQSYAALNKLFDNLLMSHPFVKRSSWKYTWIGIWVTYKNLYVATRIKCYSTVKQQQ